jgi:hypothetical protein
MKYNIGDLFISGKTTLLYISGFSSGPSEAENNEYTEYHRLTFLNGKQAGRSIWAKEEKITELIERGIYEYMPVKE